MTNLSQIPDFNPTDYLPDHPVTDIVLILLPIILLVDLCLRGLALWKASQAKRTYWFIALLVVNSLGILPALYLLYFQKKVHQK